VWAFEEPLAALGETLETPYDEDKARPLPVCAPSATRNFECKFSPRIS
jgi:hypothetical protein